jgi:hypothetical protein
MAKIDLDNTLLARAKKHAEANGYSSPEEFVAHLIERELAASEPDATPSQLKGIGYIDAGLDI